MIAQLPFGRTGHHSSRIIFGAAAFSNVTQIEADRTLALLPEYGLNHIDTAASYGEAEVRLGPWLRQHRREYFLATKTEKRTRPAAFEELQRSLDRLQTDSIDLWQIHNLSDPQEWEVALGPGGALEACVEARQQKLIRFIGITGHGLNIAAMHRRALKRFDFDSVLLPCNYMQNQTPSYAADFDALLAVCRERKVAVQTIKAIARNHWGDRAHTQSTWYEPLREQADIDRAVHWVLGHADVFLNTAADINLLPKVLDAARRYQAVPPDVAMQAMAQALEMKPLFE